MLCRRLRNVGQSVPLAVEAESKSDCRSCIEWRVEIS